MPYVETPTGSIFAIDRGQGAPPLVALHGAGGASRQWGYQLRDLSATTRVLAIDLPGHARSSGAAPRSIAEAAAQVAACLDRLGIAEAIFLGHSMGGAIAQWLALHEQQRVAGLTLIGSAAQLPVAPALLHEISLNWHVAARQIVDLAYARGTPEATLAAATDDLRAVDPATVEADYRACAAFNLHARLHEIRVPTLLLAGADDRFVPPVVVAETAQHIEHSEMVIVPDAGHMAMIEQPQAVNTAIRAFLHIRLAEKD